MAQVPGVGLYLPFTQLDKRWLKQNVRIMELSIFFYWVKLLRLIYGDLV